MERAAAIKRLGKILGKSLGYRVDPKAPDREVRDAASAEIPSASATRKDLIERMEARRSAILEADAEYQKLKKEYGEAKGRLDLLISISGHYKITVGTTNSLFFTVKAQGDSWEEVIAKLTEKEPAR